MKDILLKSNELINVISELELNRTARHIFNYFLQHAQKKVKFENYQDNTFSINYSELNKSADYNPRAVEVTLLALKNLMRPVVITDTKTEFTAIVPVTYVDINKTTGDYVFSLEKRIIELLKNTDYFTKLDLKEFNPLKSKHSIVIFEFLKRYENLPKIPKITIDELRAITDTKDKYKLFADFEKRVLKVAIAEINEYTSYNVQCTYERTRTVRRPKVQAIQFSFTKKHSGIELDVTEVTEKQVQNVAKN